MKDLQREFFAQNTPDAVQPTSQPALQQHPEIVMPLLQRFSALKIHWAKQITLKKQIFTMWSYNINCWAVYMSAAFISAIAITSPAVKVRDKTNIQGFWLPPASSSRSSHIPNQFLALHFPYRNLDALQCVPC